MGTLIHSDITEHFPEHIIQVICRIAESRKHPVFLVGGIIRDYLLGRQSYDLDLIVPKDSESFCRGLIAELGTGAFVSLAGKKEEDAARVVVADLTIDVSGFRGEKQSLEEDLLLRDFALNAMAADLLELVESQETPLIDPSYGLVDLKKKKLSFLPGAIDDDPLRMLRGFRMQARFGFALDETGKKEIAQKKHQIHRVSWERRVAELNMILASDNGAKEFREMAEVGILQELFPELACCIGVEQPDFHHLDVFDHCLEALQCMEQIIVHPESYFTGFVDDIKVYVRPQHIRVRLKWAALFHDLGKASTKAEHANEKGRVTFHQHDFVGSKMVGEIGGRIRFSRDDTKMITDLVNQHMHPFHLSNLYRENRLSTKAVVRMARKAQNHLVGLFLLAMSDSLASHGRLKPETMENEIDGLFQQVYSQYISTIVPVQKSEKFLDGNDLINEFHLAPGPVFRQILDELELAVIEKKVQNREQAVSWVEHYIKSDKCV